MADFGKKADIAFIATMLGVAAQFFIIIAVTLIWVPTHKVPTWQATVMISIPMLILLPWLVKRNIRAHVWLCFIMLGYFLNAVQQCFLHEQYGILPFFEVANTIYIFSVAMMFSRWEQKRYQISVTR
ncbi:MAG: DUF2069 domain-containing protein [Pseudomonadales bacterium]|nr:DUF2069 domain-containing protein [Pseudomonadales bacterium]